MSFRAAGRRPGMVDGQRSRHPELLRQLPYGPLHIGGVTRSVLRGVWSEPAFSRHAGAGGRGEAVDSCLDTE